MFSAIPQHDPNRALEEAGSETEGFRRDYAIVLAFQAGDDRGKADTALRQTVGNYGRTIAF